MLDLVEWVAARPRPYDEVMEAWRTSCPRLTIWEDAVDRGLVVREQKAGAEDYIFVSPPKREVVDRNFEPFEQTTDFVREVEQESGGTDPGTEKAAEKDSCENGNEEAE